VIASVLGVSAARAAAIAAEYPLQRIPRAGFFALSTIVSDANFACPALQVDRWTAKRVPTFAYEFDDDTAPPIFAGPASRRSQRTHPRSSTSSISRTRRTPHR
jgi:para-nitrobenzyl esterase